MDALPLPNFDPPALVQKTDHFVVGNKMVGYPVRGSWWTHPGEIHAHLKSGEHAGKWSSAWVDSLSHAEAESLHSDDHEGRAKAAYVVRPVTRVAATPVVTYTFGVQNCPNGQCPRR
jgi:hypothetical protein